METNSMKSLTNLQHDTTRFCNRQTYINVLQLLDCIDGDDVWELMNEGEEIESESETPDCLSTWETWNVTTRTFEKEKKYYYLLKIIYNMFKFFSFRPL